ncbi:MAG: peptidase C11 [Lachnospiraceae bacterium]|nr:peptidase C11 [Lachnospiraceae bacterium]
MANRPVSREKHVTSGGGNVYRREALSSGGRGPSGGGPNRSGGGKGPFGIIVALLALLGGGGFALFNGLSGGGSAGGAGSGASAYVEEQHSAAEWSAEENTGTLDTAVANGAREKRTVLKGGGADTATLMIYMCGTDLESKSGMASRDLQEMLNAEVGDSLNVLIYTGGCTKWQNNQVSSATNQIWQVKNGRLILLEQDLGEKSMTDPAELTRFLKWGTSNYPASRYELILWDHGGGSASGYGYDEKFKSSGSMSLAGINRALKDGGVTFDFVGFDACLMATLETGLMLEPYSDYMIASEETEPGVGWYYTDWLTAFSKNPSMDTLSLGRSIIDSFTETCRRTVPGQKTTLSLTDLAELTATVPEELRAFSEKSSQLIRNNEYQKLSDARTTSREFASSSKIDQVDLVDFATRTETEEGRALAEALRGAVKYNRTSSSMSNAYGLSVYFPYRKVSRVDGMVNTYKDIGMDASYAKCIQEFAALETAGQAAAGGSEASSPLPGLLGQFTGGGSGGLDVGSLLSSFLGGGFSSIPGLDRSNTNFLQEGLDPEQAASYLESHSFDKENLRWTENREGEKVLALPDQQWELVSAVDLSLFYDDGEGYIDLGMDNVLEFDDEENLLAPSDRTWLAINGQVVPYYRIDTEGDQNDYTITGRVPCLLNGERTNLILVFTSENPKGFVAGANTDYQDQTDAVAKNMTELLEGDRLDFIAGYYTYDGEYREDYVIGNPVIVDMGMEELQISNVNVGADEVKASYRFTDLYGQVYYSESLRM